MSSHQLHVTVVIPDYNEQSKIAQTLFEVQDYLSQCGFRAYRREVARNIAQRQKPLVFVLTLSTFIQLKTGL